MYVAGGLCVNLTCIGHIVKETDLAVIVFLYADKIIREAGLGTFGRVLECLDKQRNIIVAIKVVRQVEKYTESAKVRGVILILFLAACGKAITMLLQTCLSRSKLRFSRM